MQTTTTIFGDERIARAPLALGTVLLVDSDERARTLTAAELYRRGFDVISVADLRRARALAIENRARVIVLASDSPVLDLGLLRQGWAGAAAPRLVVLASAQGAAARAEALAAGADDLLVRPVDVDGLAHRISDQIRRFEAGDRRSAPTRVPDPAAEVYAFEGWRLYPRRFELLAPQGTPVALTVAEFNVLCAFARHPGQVLERAQLQRLTQARDGAEDPRAIDSRVSRLRRRLNAAAPGAERLIRTVRLEGYVFTAKTVHNVGGPGDVQR